MDEQKNEKREALNFLKSQKTAVVATVSSDGEPQSATVYYIMDEDFFLYFMTGRETRKFKNLSKIPRISFVVGAGPELITVQGGGSVSLLEHPYSDDLIMKLEQNLSLKESQYWPFFKLPEGAVAVFKIHPEWMRMVVLETGGKETYKEDFITILP